MKLQQKYSNIACNALHKMATICVHMHFTYTCVGDEGISPPPHPLAHTGQKLRLLSLLKANLGNIIFKLYLVFYGFFHQVRMICPKLEQSGSFSYFLFTKTSIWENHQIWCPLFRFVTSSAPFRTQIQLIMLVLVLISLMCCSSTDYYPVHLLVIPMYICTSQSLFSHLYVVNEWLNRHYDVQIDIRIWADELGIC
jgi:hypothetical protein